MQFRLTSMEMVDLIFANGVCYGNTAFQYSSWGLGDQNGWQVKFDAPPQANQLSRPHEQVIAVWLCEASIKQKEDKPIYASGQRSINDN